MNLTEVALGAAIVTAVTIFVTWACKRLGRFGGAVLVHLGSFSRLPAAVETLGTELRAAVTEFRTDREDFAARIVRLETHTGVNP